MKRIIRVTALVVLAAVGMAAGWHRFATAAVPAGAEQVVHMTAKRFEYNPSEITLKKGVPVILEITALDRDHGFKIPELNVRADLKSGEVTRVRILPDQFFRPSAALPPEKRLMLAVLEGALLDLQRSAGARTPRARQLRDEVDAWFAADGEDWPFSFVNLCYALGLDASAVRRRLAPWRRMALAKGVSLPVESD